MREGWLLNDGRVLAAADIAEGFADRTRGLAGRSGYHRALVVTNKMSAHSLGVRFGVDVAFLDDGLRVVHTARLAPWRVTRPRWRCRTVLQASAGSFERWGLKEGDVLEVTEPA